MSRKTKKSNKKVKGSIKKVKKISVPVDCEVSVKKRKATRKPLLRFEGRVLSFKLRDTLLEIRCEMVKKGLFWSYKKIIAELFDVIKMVMIHGSENKELIYAKHNYRFINAVVGRLDFEINDFTFNQGVYWLFNLNRDNKHILNHFREFKGHEVVRMPFLKVIEASHQELSRIWSGISRYKGLFDVPSPYFAIMVGVERVTGYALIDFRQYSSISISYTDLYPYVD